jgi:hypothetical protein
MTRAVWRWIVKPFLKPIWNVVKVFKKLPSVISCPIFIIIVLLRIGSSRTGKLFRANLYMTYCHAAFAIVAMLFVRSD